MGKIQATMQTGRQCTRCEKVSRLVKTPIAIIWIARMVSYFQSLNKTSTNLRTRDNRLPFLLIPWILLASMILPPASPPSKRINRCRVSRPTSQMSHYLTLMMQLPTELFKRIATSNTLSARHSPRSPADSKKMLTRSYSIHSILSSPTSILPTWILRSTKGFCQPEVCKSLNNLT